MRVRARSAFTAVRDCQIISVSEGQEIHGDFAVYLLKTGAEVEALDDKPVDEVPPADELDIDGKIDDVLAWVGDDPERALEAHTAEEAKGDKSRPRLLSKLAELIDEA